jgi:hypothetical protein
MQIENSMRFISYILIIQNTFIKDLSGYKIFLKFENIDDWYGMRCSEKFIAKEKKVDCHKPPEPFFWRVS